MQVQNVQSPNFGMSMTIKPAAREAIVKGGESMVEAIKRAGEIVKDTKLVHLEIGEKAIPTIITPYANKYTQFFSAEKPVSLTPEFLHVKTIWAGPEHNPVKKGDAYIECIKMENAKAAQEAYENMSKAKSEIERGAIFTKLLDDRLAKKEAESTLKAEKTKQLEAQIDKLLEQFGEK